MTILAVSNNFSLLERLCNGLSSIFPDADIIRETDSLMAGKYSFNHNIDMLFADVNMKRMGGVELIRFARQEHPGVLSYDTVQLDSHARRSLVARDQCVDVKYHIQKARQYHPRFHA